MYRPSGYLIVRLPQYCEHLSSRLGHYRGLDRMSWFFANSNWDRTLDDAFRADLGLPLVDLETATAIYKHESDNIASVSEVIAVRVAEERAATLSGPNPIPKWIGYDLVIKGMALSILTSAFAYSPANRLHAWSRRLNSFGLFDELSEGYLFANEYIAESDLGAVEPCGLDELVHVEIGLLSVE